MARRPIVIAPAAIRSAGGRRRCWRCRAARPACSGGAPCSQPANSATDSKAPAPEPLEHSGVLHVDFPLAGILHQDPRQQQSTSAALQSARLAGAISTPHSLNGRRAADTPPLTAESHRAVAGNHSRRPRALRGKRLRGVDLSSRVVRAALARDRLVGAVARRAARDVHGRPGFGQPTGKPRDRRELCAAAPLRARRARHRRARAS